MSDKMKDNIGTGLAIGVIFPGIAYLLSTFTTFQQHFFSDKPIGIYVIAGLLNLIAVRFLFRGGYQQIAKGIVLITFLSMILMIVILKLKV